MAKENNKPNSYIYHRQWFNFQHEHMEHVSANHIALYLYVVEINNRLAWVKSFGLTVREGMDGMRCKSRNTYLNTFHDLVNWGFFKIVKPAKNQYQCNVIALPIFKQAKITFFDESVIKNQEIYRKSLIKNSTGIDTGNGSGIDTIHQTNLQLTNLQLVVIEYAQIIEFFNRSKLKTQLQYNYKLSSQQLEKMIENFYNLKVDCGDFNNKNASEILKYFSNWLPNEILREKEFNNKNQKLEKNGNETIGSVTAIANAGASARNKAIANLNPDGSFR